MACRNPCCHIPRPRSATLSSCSWRIWSRSTPLSLESLARGYVYLAQFIPDADAAILAQGPIAQNSTGALDAHSEPAMRLLNRIKLDMERALEELHALGAYGPVK